MEKGLKKGLPHQSDDILEEGQQPHTVEWRKTSTRQQPYLRVSMQAASPCDTRKGTCSAISLARNYSKLCPVAAIPAYVVANICQQDQPSQDFRLRNSDAGAMVLPDLLVTPYYVWLSQVISY